MAEDNGPGLTPEQIAAKASTDATAKAAAEKAAADARLLDESGNPKSAETLAAEAAEEARIAGVKAGDAKAADDLKGKVEGRAKQVEDLVKAADVDPSEMIAQADKESGELSVAHKAKLIEKHGEAIADLIEGNVQKMVADIKKMADSKTTSVYTQLEEEFKGVTEQSGKETWAELSTWIKENTDIATRTAYNKMLDAGGLSAKLAVKEMVASFKEKNNFTVDAQLLDTDGTANVGSSGFITRQEYNTELGKLLDSGHDYNTSPEIAALDRKRTKSMQMGK